MFVKRSGREVRSGRRWRLVWKENKGLDRRLDCIDDPGGCLGIVFGHIFPNASRSISASG